MYPQQRNCVSGRLLFCLKWVQCKSTSTCLNTKYTTVAKLILRASNKVNGVNTAARCGWASMSHDALTRHPLRSRPVRCGPACAPRCQPVATVWAGACVNGPPPASSNHAAPIGCLTFEKERCAAASRRSPHTAGPSSSDQPRDRRWLRRQSPIAARPPSA